MKALEEYLKLDYKASVYKDEDGDFVVEIVDLPGCVTHGATIAEAFENLEEAKKVWMESRLAAGLEIPRPKNRAEYSGRVLLRMPRSLHRALSNQAQQEGVSLNQHIVSLLSTGYAWGQTTVVNILQDGMGTSPSRVLGRNQLMGCSVSYAQDYSSVSGLGGTGLTQCFTTNSVEPLTLSSVPDEIGPNAQTTVTRGAA